MASISGKIDKVIDELTMTSVKRFYPTYVAKHAELPLEEVLSYLTNLVRMKKLKLYWEVCCEAPGCCRTITSSQDIDSLLGKTLYCDLCGEEVEVTQYNVFPIFEFDEEYKLERNLYFKTLKKKRQTIGSKNYCRFRTRKPSC